MATVETLELKIVDSSIKAVNGLNKLAATLQKLKDITTGNLGLNKVSNQMENLNKALSGINEEYVRRLERIANALRSIKYTGKVKIPTYNQLKRATEPKKPKDEDAPQAPTGLQAFLARLRSFLGISNATKASLSGIADAANKAGNSMKDASKRTYGFIDSAKFLLKYQLIFTIFSTLANALKEGIGNLYNWSKAMGGSFARSLDTAKSKVTLLKNSVATALAPALTALIPVFNAVANAIVFCLNAIAQLISAFRGLGTWTKATEAVGDYTSAVKGAGAAQKGLLASFDELNIIASKAGGGGGGMADAWEGAFEEKELSPFFKWISEHMTLIKTLALLVGGAVATWKISSTFISALGSMDGKFGKIAGLAAAVGGAIMDINATSEALKNGTSWDTLTGQIAGTSLMALGLHTILGKIGGAIALLFGGGSMLISGLKDWQREGRITKETLATLEAGIVGITTALSLLTGNWLFAAIGVGIAFVGEIFSRVDDMYHDLTVWWRSIKKNFSEWVEQAKRTFQMIKDWINERLVQPFLDWVDQAKKTFKMIWDWVYEKLIAPVELAIEKIVSWINTIIDWVSKKDTKIIEVKYSSGTTPSGHSYTSTYNMPVSSGGGMTTVEMVDFKQYSSGGFPTEGQLFMAREAGPELVGTIGGRSAVANNDQIVAGVANGVAAGQAEQNALLRKQNELLTQILRKEFSAKVVPSAGLGRVNAQSNAMYSRVAGVNT